MSFEVDGDLRAILAELAELHPDRLTSELNERWADEGAARLREYVGGGPVTNYLTARSGGTRDSVMAQATATGGTLSASSPGMELLEEGGVITPKRGEYLTFRLYNAWDGAEPTGEWIRTRRVTIKARHPVRDAAQQALDLLPDFLSDLLGDAV